MGQVVSSGPDDMYCMASLLLPRLIPFQVLYIDSIFIAPSCIIYWHLRELCSRDLDRATWAFSSSPILGIPPLYQRSHAESLTSHPPLLSLQSPSSKPHYPTTPFPLKSTSHAFLTPPLPLPPKNSASAAQPPAPLVSSHLLLLTKSSSPSPIPLNRPCPPPRPLHPA